jgi:hypothetical protein
MDYDSFTASDQREAVRQRIRALEQEHYTNVLNKLANMGNKAAEHSHDENLRKLETAIRAMRDEAARLDGVTDASS